MRISSSRVVRRAVGDVVGDLLGPTDTAAGDHPMLTVLAVPRPHLDAGPVEDPTAVGSIATGSAFPLLPRQAGEQLVDGVVDGPAGDDGVVAGGGQDVEDIGLLELEAPPLLKPSNLVADAGPAAAFAVVCPGGGQIEATVDQRAFMAGGVGEEHADLGVLGASRGAGVLPLGPGRPNALLEEAGVLNDQDGVLVSEVFDDIVTYVVPKPRRRPTRGSSAVGGCDRDRHARPPPPAPSHSYAPAEQFSPRIYASAD